MLQRIQTVYFTIALLLIASPMFGLTLFSVKIDQLGVNTFDVTPFAVLSNGNSIQSAVLWIYCVIPIIAVLLTIFTFKTREKQMTLAKMSILLVLLISGWFVVSGYQFLSKSEYPKNHGVILGIGFYLFVSSVIFLILGFRGVRKDKKLIDSVDRIR